ncbi:MAG: hypothetical protein WD894_05950 [Pirellulales bacterium]
MISTSDKPLTLTEAARLIYQTSQPTAEQVYRVLARIKGGVLKGTRGGKSGWTTTTESVAEYLARQSVYHQAARQDGPARNGRQPPPLTSIPTLPEEHSRTLRTAYGEMLKEYFLAVLLRRKRDHRSKLFQRCVVATQFALIVFVFWLGAATVRQGMAPIASERRAVEKWIEENAGGRFQVIEWYASEPSAEGMIVPVEYRYYRKGAKPVETHRTFLVVGDEVKLLDNE